ncbi:AAA domain-containing protein [Lichenicoccus sp.]|uniref:AAA domain-containing protein n=1 Tax=Lichenicoccus sp. TaxID=2781899 RepID=UPI003D1115F8
MNDWFNRAGWPDALHRKGGKPGRLAELDPPPRYPEAMARWRQARDNFRQARAHSTRLRDEPAAMSRACEALRRVETELPQAGEARERFRLDQASASQAVATARSQVDAAARQESLEAAKLTALISLQASVLSRLLRTRAWQAHESGIREQVARLDAAQRATRDARARLAVAAAEEERLGGRHAEAKARLETLLAETARFGQQLEDGRSELGDSLPGPGFWSQPDDLFQTSSPWNGGRFRHARDALFVTAVRLHHAFVIAGVRPLKKALNTVVLTATNAPGAPRPSAQDWGFFFLLVPVVSTTFASIGRMFNRFPAASIGWLLIDEAGQAAPQQAVGAIWRARRAVVIGDPMQIEPVVTTPEHTTALIFRGNGLDSRPWAAPRVSGQGLADRASATQGHFPIEDPVSGGPTTRITGIPLLAHREEWRGAGVFSRAAQAFPLLPADEWIGQNALEAVS